MLFNSYIFILVFMPTVLVLYFSLAHFRLTRLASASLVVASLVFYAYWNIYYLPLLLGSIFFNYRIGGYIVRNKSRAAMILGVVVNVLLLGFFKYTGFLVETINSVGHMAIWVPKIILPIGISFFTFTQIAFLVDMYREDSEEYDLLSYCLFVTFFPNLLAGPIQYHKDMIPQFSRLRNFIFSPKNLSIGLTYFCMGLFKKVVIADTLSPWVKVVFDVPEQVCFIEAWAGALAYTLQLYFDFSGYSDMAIGLGLMLNIKLPFNFNSPYKATSIPEFWRRWHMTLAGWLMKYIFMPLNIKFRDIRNLGTPMALMVVFLVCGLWHGANWTFILWGALHGFYMISSATTQKLRKNLEKRMHVDKHPWIEKSFKNAGTLLLIVFGWVIFRANSISDAFALLKTMLGFNGIVLSDKWAKILFFAKPLGVKFQALQYLPQGSREILIIAALIAVVLLAPNVQETVKSFRATWQWSLAVGTVMAICLLSLNRISAFLYFQF